MSTNKLPMKSAKQPDIETVTLPPNGSSTVIVGKIKVELVSVEVPYVTTATSAYIDSELCKRCDLGVLSREQARKLRAIRRGYEYSGRRLANGNEVKSLADAVKILLDSIEI